MSDLGPEPLTGRLAKLAKDGTDFYMGIGTLVMAFDQYDGTIIVLSAPNLSEKHVRLARHHKRYLEFLERLFSSNDYLNAILAHTTLLGIVLAHHDRMPDRWSQHFNLLGQKILTQLPPEFFDGSIPNNNQAIPTMV